MMRTTQTLSMSCLVLAMVATAAGVVRAGETAVTFESLLQEMVDRDASARFPDPVYTCGQQSSYDPRSVTPDDPEGWMANADWSHYRRSQKHDGRTERVMLDAAGPGCVVRIWTTAFNPRGTIRVYIDDAPEPAIEERIDRLIGGDALVGPPLSEVRARGMNLYMPIPYAKRCVITYDRLDYWKTRLREDQLYYQINYRTYEPGTRVQSFSRKAFDAARRKIAQVQKELLSPNVGIRSDSLEPVVYTLARGEEKRLATLGAAKNTGALRSLAVRLEADDPAQASRSTVISIEFDGRQTVWCPVGDFFGSGVGVNPYQGWWRTVDDDGWMTCYWVMPYQKTCKIRFENLGKQDVTVALKTVPGKWTWDDRSMYFHANWRQEYPIDTSVKRDWNYLETTGRGVYMGDTLALVNPIPNWWGEGDEKIYVDGETFPSHYGTGTEDYYGYAWCTPEFFCSPFHSQPRAEGPQNQGHVTNTRVRLLDQIPFTTSLRIDMEVWHWRPAEIAYAVATYWYGRPGAEGNYGPAPNQVRIEIPGPPEPGKIAGAIEGEDLKVLQCSAGTAEVQYPPKFKWSNDRQIWWKGAKPGDRLVLAMPVPKSGTYRVIGGLTKGPDYGVVRVSVDGTPRPQPIDLYNPTVITREFPLGLCELTRGDHELTIEITDANPNATKQYQFGIDYLKLEPVE